MTMDFRSRSADVRREAADILWRFRSSRAARRTGATPDGGGSPTDGALRSALPVSPATEELIRAARRIPLSDGPPSPPTATEAADVPVADPVEPAPVDDDPALGHVSGDAAPADADASAAPTGDDKMVTLPGAADDAPGEHGTPADAPAAPPDMAADAPDLAGPPTGPGSGGSSPGAGPPAARDLTDLPGVGAGLVWLLGRCGVHTLDDLAHADAARLETDLGLVGQLLDLPSWIDLARQAVKTERKRTS